MQMAAIYTRVSSERQREAHTIASQTAALVEWATTLDLEVPRDWIFEDDGYSGATLERPGLERVRDLAAAGDIEVVLVHSPELTAQEREDGRIPDFPVTRSHPPASWPSAANSSICRTYRKTAGEESRRRSPVANRWMRP